jgi:Immunoglobulin domain
MSLARSRVPVKGNNMKSTLTEEANRLKMPGLASRIATGWAFLIVVTTSLAQTIPIVVTQPQGQNATAGSNVTLSVTVEGSPSLPGVSSGSLQLWLKADAGVVTNGSGLVSQWQDQSGNTNNATQANTNLQPALVSASDLYGRPVVRFNGIQNNTNGSYLFGAGAVNVPNAMTAFTVYNALSTTNNENSMWLIGVPDVFGTDRADNIDQGYMYFTFWNFANFTSFFVVPTNTYRIRTDRLDTNLDTLDMFDASANSATNFTLPVNGATTLGTGYYIGGLNSSVGPNVGSSRNFCGDYAELIFYQGYLTEADRLAVTSYLEQKYFLGVTNGASFQWQFDDTNIVGASNATLTLSDAQINQSGTYTVIVSNSAGSITSSNAVVVVGYSPSITSQPQAQEVVQGSNVTFTVDASGTGPFAYQWFFDGSALSQATTSTLSLTNVQGADSGTYSVNVSSPFGSIASSNAALTVDLFPVILTQPQSENVAAGSNVTLSVAVEGSAALPAIGSGTLQLWLKADAGVVANGTGLVSQWQDQSSNSNNAAQANTNLQPTLAFAAGLGGRPVVRFNGIQNNVNGSYLFGAGTVNVPNAMTAFTVYDAFSTTNRENITWEIGVPDDFGANRIAMITLGELHFSFWAYDFSAPFVVPTNTYRIRTDRLDTNLDTLDMFDATADTSTNFTLSVNGAITPGAGYYLGGINTNIGQPYVGLSRNFYGDIAELIVYQGYLMETDRQAVATYLQQKYFTGVTSGSSFQWQFNGTNIAGATNATLTLPDAQTNESGTYSVIVSNSAGSVTSSNAVVTVGDSPSITSQPQTQEIVQGSNVTFTVNASGAGPLDYQWYFDGSALSQATTSTLSLTNVQGANNGEYSVSVSSPFGSVVSSNAVLTVDLFPIILTQPQSQGGVIGSNVTLSVTIEGSASLPSVSSGTLQLWLKADTGVVANGAGLVSQWQDQSSNSNNAAQANTNLQPKLAFPAGLGGMPAVRFNGVQNNISGSYLFGSGLVNVPNAMTVFTVYNAFDTTNTENIILDIGIPGVYNANRVPMITLGELHFSFWQSFDASVPFVVPTNTYRIRTDRLDTNLDTLDIFDTTADSETNFSQSVVDATAPGAGYYLGGLNSSVQSDVGSSRNFCGDIAEIICYQGYLTDADRQAVATYLQQKYFTGVANGVAFQWQLDGTNIAGATNATLTLTDLQSAQAGTYSVIVSDLAGSVTSSNAVLTALFPPTITSSPLGQTVAAGSSVTFSASATGNAPLAFQWQFDGTNIVGAINTSLTLNNVLAVNSGSYTFVATNAYGSATSSAAVLTVNETTIQIVTTNIQIIVTNSPNDDTIVIPINMNALGTEVALGLSLDFDPTVLTFRGVTLGSGAAGGALQVNSNQVASGILGLGVDLFSGAFSAGTNDVFDVTFQISPVTNTTTTVLTFGNSPTEEQVSDAHATSLPTVYVPGSLVISPTPLEGDVSPRPNGNEIVNITDWVQEGRFVAGLDTVSNGSEFQRADCAPRSTLGDGQITVADWVQVGRYAVGLDPITAAGGPTSPVSQNKMPFEPVKTGLSRPVMLVPLSRGTLTNSVAVELVAQGDENALGFSVNFDPSLLRFVKASLGTGATGAALIQNTTNASSGVLGFVVGFTPPGAFAPGTQPVLNLNFASITYSNTASLAFVNTPVVCQLADTNALAVPATFQNGTLAVGGSPWPSLSIGQSEGNLTLSWPSAGASLGLQTASSLEGPWSNVVAVPSTNGESVVITTSVSTNSQYFRLKY